jgi:hypothetical protein
MMCGHRRENLKLEIQAAKGFTLPFEVLLRAHTKKEPKAIKPDDDCLRFVVICAQKSTQKTSISIDKYNIQLIK